MDKFLITLIIASCAGLVWLMSFYFWGSDNPVEEACEDIVKAETGVGIDLTPGTPEKAPEAKDETGNKAAS